MLSLVLPGGPPHYSPAAPGAAAVPARAGSGARRHVSGRERLGHRGSVVSVMSVVISNTPVVSWEFTSLENTCLKLGETGAQRVSCMCGIWCNIGTVLAICASCGNTV